jgi:hypothetical protein
MGFLDALSGLGSGIASAGRGFLSGLAGNPDMMDVTPGQTLNPSLPGGDRPIPTATLANPQAPPDPGPIQTMPTFQKAGLLERMQTPDARTGLSFSDRLMGAGMALAHDPGGALAIRQQGMQQVLAQQALARQQAAAAAQGTAVSDALGANPKTAALAQFAKSMGPNFDPRMLGELAPMLAPKPSYMNAGPDIVQLPGEYGGGQPTVAYKGQRPAPTGYAWGPDGKLGFIPGGPADPIVQGGKVEQGAKIRSKYRTPPRGPRPSSYGADEVTVGG